MSVTPDLIERIVGAMARLVTLAEGVDDEWTYIHDLDTVWTARLRAVASERSSVPGPAGLAAAIDRLIEEAGSITDPHRAIDWLSTLPQATLVALGEPAW